MFREELLRRWDGGTSSSRGRAGGNDVRGAGGQEERSAEAGAGGEGEAAGEEEEEVLIVYRVARVFTFCYSLTASRADAVRDHDFRDSAFAVRCATELSSCGLLCCWVCCC